ncbi:MAG: HEAT repeat domain-containing protein [Candidatus Dadabacteria bacterium]|nr:MAG: HEAT repeat domain-containing protein [Candidatus Dadabacteria bacterium]
MATTPELRGEGGTSDPGSLIAGVAHGGLRRREEAIAALLQQPMDTLLPFLLDRIEAHDFAERNAAIEVLERLGPAAWSQLEPLLDGLSSEGCMFVAPALATFQDARVLSALHRWALSEDPNLAAMSCEAIGKLGEPESVPVLQQVCATDPWTAGPAITALGKIATPAAVRTLEELVRDEDLAPFAIVALAQLPRAASWPLLAEAVREDPSMAGIVLAEGARLFEALDRAAIQHHAHPRNIWVQAAREVLEQTGDRSAAARLLGALQDVGAARKLVDLYLFGDDATAYVEALQAMDGAIEIVREHASRALGDEASRRAVRLLSAISDQPERDLIPFLTHAAASVRLEALIALRPVARKVIGLVAGLLSDPDVLVRKTALQVVELQLELPGVADEIVSDLDFESLPEDVLLLLAQQAPEPLPSAIARFLRSKSQGVRDELRVVLDLREQPERALDELEARARAGQLTEPDLIALLQVERPEAAQFLMRRCQERSPLAGVAAEMLAVHPCAKQEDVERLIAACRRPEVLAALAGFRAVQDRRAFVRTLLAVPVQSDAVAELAILRAGTRLDPQAFERRLRQALDHKDWRLQLAAAKALSGAGIDVGHRTALDARVRDVLIGNV